MAVDPRWEKNQRMYVAVSSASTDLVVALEEIIEDGAWREFHHPMDGLLRFDRFAEYCNEFLRVKPEAIVALLDKSMAKMAADTVRQMLRQDIPALTAHGGNRQMIEQVDNINLPSGGSDPAYVVARLKRDDPDLARKVIDGELSANAAAIQAGIKRPRAQILVDDPHEAIRGLLKHFTVEQLQVALDGAKCRA